MSGEHHLGDRRKALEEAFFAKQNEALRQGLRAMDAARQTKEALSAASGITDDAVLERLAALNIASESLAALSLVPVVAVAWADGTIDDKERSAALAAAAEIGLGQQGVSRQLFEQWLARKPSEELLAAWKDYVGALSGTLDDDARRELKAQTLGRARAVAEAVGGVLGIGRKISGQEEAALRELEMAFAR